MKEELGLTITLRALLIVDWVRLGQRFEAAIQALANRETAYLHDGRTALP